MKHETTEKAITEKQIIEAFQMLNENGKRLALQNCFILSEYETYRAQTTDEDQNPWTGYYRSVKREGNIITPVWG